MKRIAILDHADHSLLVEDVNETALEKIYGGDEQAYINDNYTFEGDYSWEWITDAEYFPEGQNEPIEIDFEEIGDIY